jgi:protein O-GlcNAc transferase
MSGIDRRQNLGARDALRAIDDAPDGGNAMLSQALELQRAGDFAAAEKLYRRFLMTHPTHFGALNNAALVAKALGRHDVALMRLGKVVRRNPNVAEAHFNLANTLQEVGRLAESVAAYRQAIALRPDYAKAHRNLGNALDKQRHFEEATACYERALHYGEDGETYYNLGHCLREQGRGIDALVHFICATELEPERAIFHFAAGGFRFELGDHHEASASFRRVLELEPEHEGARSGLLFQAQLACDWSETAALAPLVRAATERSLRSGIQCSEGPFESLTRDADPSRNFAVAMSTGKAHATKAQLYRPKPRRQMAKPEKIRLGYLSADFREHPVAQVMGGVFARHDRERFVVTAYSYGQDDGGPLRRRIAADCDHFVDLYRVGDDAAARRICDDEIDILVDLTVWTRGNRPRICALRPAGVQIQYLGFPGTSGAPYYDYAIIDRSLVLPEERAFWSEQLIYMPHSYFVADRDQAIAATGLRRQDCGLPKDSVVFCSFNQNIKIEPVGFGAWMRILAEVPGSVLWLPRSDDIAESNLRREAANHGIATERLVFAERVAEKVQHLERLGLADIALDTLAYNGHTTTSDALWAGVPVVAVRGGHFASRVSASLLKAVELEGLIAGNADDYVRLAVRLAQSPDERASLRAHLLGARLRLPLFDTDQSVVNLEQAYENVWSAFCAGAPRSDIFL